MAQYTFIYETAGRQRLRLLIVTALLLVAIAGSAITFMLLFSGSAAATYLVQALRLFVMNDLGSLSPLSVFYLSFIGGLFFVPGPTEVLYATAIVRGGPILLTFVSVIAGTILSHWINYAVGMKFSTLMLRLVSKKKVYRMRRVINRYGSYAIILFVLSPLPSGTLAVALGLAKYNVRRFLTLMFAGFIAKYLVITAFLAAFW